MRDAPLLFSALIGVWACARPIAAQQKAEQCLIKTDAAVVSTENIRSRKQLNTFLTGRIADGQKKPCSNCAIQPFADRVIRKADASQLEGVRKNLLDRIDSIEKSVPDRKGLRDSSACYGHFMDLHHDLNSVRDSDSMRFGH